MSNSGNKMQDRTSILDGSVSCPLHSHGAKWYEELESFKNLHTKSYPGLTADECWRMLDYDAKQARYKVVRHNRNIFIGSALTDAEQDDWRFLMEKNMKYIDAELKEKKTTKTHGSYELGPREFTFTYSPGWFTDAEAREKMSKAIDRLCNIYADEIVELHARGEVGKNGMSHVHCYYELQGGLKITDKNFKRVWPKWNPKQKFGKGFQGGHHETVKSKSDFIGYINEDAFNWLKKDIDKRT